MNSDMDGLSYIQDSAEGPFQEHMIYAILSGLGIDQNKLSQPLNSMSGGQQTKILLTKLLLEKSNILLLDVFISQRGYSFFNRWMSRKESVYKTFFTFCFYKWIINIEKCCSVIFML